MYIVGCPEMVPPHPHHHHHPHPHPPHPAIGCNFGISPGDGKPPKNIQVMSSLDQ